MAPSSRFLESSWQRFSLYSLLGIYSCNISYRVVFLIILPVIEHSWKNLKKKKFYLKLNARESKSSSCTEAVSTLQGSNLGDQKAIVPDSCYVGYLHVARPVSLHFWELQVFWKKIYINLVDCQCEWVARLCQFLLLLLAVAAAPIHQDRSVYIFESTQRIFKWCPKVWFKNDHIRVQCFRDAQDLFIGYAGDLLAATPRHLHQRKMPGYHCLWHCC